MMITDIHANTEERIIRFIIKPLLNFSYCFFREMNIPEIPDAK